MKTLTPSPALLCKLASIAVHADEMMSDDGHDFDRVALKSAIDDPEVKEWIAEMTTTDTSPSSQPAPERGAFAGRIVRMIL